MTTGQQMSLASMSQRQAGEAFANTQRRVQGLRDQGLQQGLSAHQNQYNAGQDSKRMFQGSLDQRSGLEGSYQGLSQGLRGERSGYQGSIANANMGKQTRALGGLQENLGIDQGFARDVVGRGAGLSQMKMGQANADMGQLQTQQQMQAQTSAANAAASAQQNAAMIGAAGTVAGAAIGSFGGPAGTMAGATLGGMAGKMAAGDGGTAVAPQQAPANMGLGMQQSTYNPNAGNYAGRYSLAGRMST